MKKDEKIITKPSLVSIFHCEANNRFSIGSSMTKFDIFTLENGLYVFKFQDEQTSDDIMEEKIWHIANKPI